jgi:hypothetical protein
LQPDLIHIRIARRLPTAARNTSENIEWPTCSILVLVPQILRTLRDCEQRPRTCPTTSATLYTTSTISALWSPSDLYLLLQSPPLPPADESSQQGTCRAVVDTLAFASAPPPPLVHYDTCVYDDQVSVLASHQHSLKNNIMASPLFCFLNSNKFPCSADPIVLVSLGLGAGVCALLFVLYLLRQVSITSACVYILILETRAASEISSVK